MVNYTVSLAIMPPGRCSITTAGDRALSSFVRSPTGNLTTAVVTEYTNYIKFDR
ncbi:MAG: hypothetical protein AB4038_04785 [Prochloraceae cyanobacterium]